MKIFEILNLESTNVNSIHLIHERLFWTCSELSAYYFIKNFRDYKVNHKFIKKSAQDRVWIAFPNSLLIRFLDLARKKSLTIDDSNPEHIIISGLTKIEGFNKWKDEIINRPPDPTESYKSITNSNYLFNKTAYDFSLYILKLVSKYDKSYKFSLGQRLTDLSLSIVESSYLYVNNISNSGVSSITSSLLRMRIFLRISNELTQISQSQWLFTNTQIETLLKLMPSESNRLMND